MSNEFIWLAVDSNGDERLSTNPGGFQRFSPALYAAEDRTERNKVVAYVETVRDHDVWIEFYEKGSVPKTGAFPHWNFLPKGTIERIIGRKMTWDDEPVKITEECYGNKL